MLPGSEARSNADDKVAGRKGPTRNRYSKAIVNEMHGGSIDRAKSPLEGGVVRVFWQTKAKTGSSFDHGTQMYAMPPRIVPDEQGQFYTLPSCIFSLLEKEPISRMFTRMINELGKGRRIDRLDVFPFIVSEDAEHDRWFDSGRGYLSGWFLCST